MQTVGKDHGQMAIIEETPDDALHCGGSVHAYLASVAQRHWGGAEGQDWRIKLAGFGALIPYYARHQGGATIRVMKDEEIATTPLIARCLGRLRGFLHPTG